MRQILIVEDHAIFRRGLKDILQDEWADVVLTEASTGQEALSKVREQPWDIIVLDLKLPDTSGIEVLKDIKRLHPRLPVIILSLYPEEQYAVRALKSGASGYLTKASVVEELLAAIQKVLQGGTYVSVALAEQLVTNVCIEQRSLPHETLSDREFEVFRLIIQGHSLTDIADILAVSAKTVSTYKSRIHEKMALKTTAELVRYAFNHNLMD